MSEDLTYSMLHEMMMKKFNLEANSQINLSFKLSSFDYTVDITDDAEVHVGHGGCPYSKNALVITPFLFISDRHAAIALAVETEFPLSFHVSYTLEDFATSITILEIVQPDAYNKLCGVGVQRWSRAHCLLVRYNYMTSNSVESVNARSVIYRKEHVLKLAETYRVMVQQWYYQRRQLVANVTYEITDWATHKVAKRSMKSAKWVVKGVNKYQYQVSDGLPCGHVIAVTRFLGLTDCVQYVSDWFKKPKYQGTYSESIHFLGNMQQWEFWQNIQKAIPPRMDNP
ncbi:hypothetical protein Tco_0126418 [Tanacetum coccineum]